MRSSPRFLAISLAALALEASTPPGPATLPGGRNIPAASAQRGTVEYHSGHNSVTTGLAGPADSIVLRILAINDFHGAVEPRVTPWSGGKRVGGAAALKRWMDSLAADCHCPGLRLDAGDEWQGTTVSNFSHGQVVIEAFGLIGVAAAAVGNHEFDWSVDTLQTRVGASRYPWLAANLYDRQTGTRPDWLKNWVMVERGALRIAIIGLITTSTPITTRPSNVTRFRFAEGGPTVRELLPEVRHERPDLVIVLAHAGATCDAKDCSGEIVDVARSLDSAAVNLIVGGHVHRLFNATVNGIPIVQARSHGTNLAVVDVIRRPDGRLDTRVRVDTVWTDAVTPDSAVSQLVARYRQRVDGLVSQPMVTFRSPLVRREGESALGRLIADAFRWAGQADVALANTGGIRSDLPAGAVNYGQLYEVAPFGNQLVRLTVPGTTLLDVLEHAAGNSPRLLASVSGLEVQYDPRRPRGRRVVRATLLDGRSIEPTARYGIVVQDFLADGGDGFSMLARVQRTSVGMEDLDGLIGYLRQLPSPIEAPTSERWRAVP